MTLNTGGRPVDQVVVAMQSLGKECVVQGETVDVVTIVDGNPVSDDSVTQEQLDAALLSAGKRARRDEVTAERDRLQHLGVPYAFPDAVMGTIDTRNSDDMANILGLHQAALGLMTAAPDVVFCSFRDAEDQVHDLTPSQMAALYQAVMARRTALYQHGWTLKGQIEAAADEVALDAIDLTVGWPALPTP